MTSSADEPRWKSEWIGRAHRGRRALVEGPGSALLLAGGEVGAQAEQVIGSTAPSGRRAFPETEALASISARSAGSEIAAASASSWTHMPITSTLSPASLNSAATPPPLRDPSSFSPTFHHGENSALVSRKWGRGSRCGGLSPRGRAVAHRSVPPPPRGGRRSSPRLLSSFDWRSTAARRFSTVSRSARAEARFDHTEMLERDRTARARRRRRRPEARRRSRRPPGYWRRTCCRGPLTGRALDGPPMSTTSTAAWMVFFDDDIAASRSRRSSGTFATPMFGSLVAKA